MPTKKTAAKSLVQVTFSLPASVQAEKITLCGEFNDWATDTNVLERGGDGNWSTVIDLEPGRSYRYRYLIDGTHWENDWVAHAYEPNSHGSDDSVVFVPEVAPAKPRRSAAPRSKASVSPVESSSDAPPEALPTDAT
jgi:1,4-alpha-glucan branching enzyme